MRLIDAGLLLDHLSGRLESMKDYDAVKDVVNNMPIAYDVDKVVEQLEEERELSYANFDEYVEEVSPCLDAEYHDTFSRGLERAARIVKDGVRTDDVCVWKYSKEIMDNVEFEVGCNQTPLKRGIVPNNFSYHEFRFCPFCGKKMKVVD